MFSLACDGHLYIFDKNRKLMKWMNIKVDKAISCTMTNDLLFCGCSDGVIRVFFPKTLEHKMTLPKPPPLGTANIEAFSFLFREKHTLLLLFAFVSY